MLSGLRYYIIKFFTVKFSLSSASQKWSTLTFPKWTAAFIIIFFIYIHTISSSSLHFLIKFLKLIERFFSWNSSLAATLFQKETKHKKKTKFEHLFCSCWNSQQFWVCGEKVETWNERHSTVTDAYGFSWRRSGSKTSSAVCWLIFFTFAHTSFSPRMLPIELHEWPEYSGILTVSVSFSCEVIARDFSMIFVWGMSPLYIYIYFFFFGVLMLRHQQWNVVSPCLLHRRHFQRFYM